MPEHVLIPWPDTLVSAMDASDDLGRELPVIVRGLSDDDLKLASASAFQRNVWSPLAKAVLLEVWRRWTTMVLLSQIDGPPPPTLLPRQSAFGLIREDPR